MTLINSELPLFLFCSAFTTNLKHNNQEYVLELVDTAGQVNKMLISSHVLRVLCASLFVLVTSCRIFCLSNGCPFKCRN